MNICHTCMNCSLDGIYCHLLHRTTAPDGSCRHHIPGSDRHTQLRLIVRNQTTKKIIINKHNQ